MTRLCGDAESVTSLDLALAFGFLRAQGRFSHFESTKAANATTSGLWTLRSNECTFQRQQGSTQGPFAGPDTPLGEGVAVKWQRLQLESLVLSHRRADNESSALIALGLLGCEGLRKKC